MIFFLEFFFLEFFFFFFFFFKFLFLLFFFLFFFLLIFFLIISFINVLVFSYASVLSSIENTNYLNDALELFFLLIIIFFKMSSSLFSAQDVQTEFSSKISAKCKSDIT